MKLIVQIGFGADIYLYKGKYRYRVIENATSTEVISEAESATLADIAFAINTNVGFDYDISKHFGVRALIKSNYRSSMKGIDPNLSVVVAARLLF